MEVKTVGPSFDHDGYRATRAFYETMGFIPLEEVTGLDWDGPTIIMVKPLISGGGVMLASVCVSRHDIPAC